MQTFEDFFLGKIVLYTGNFPLKALTPGAPQFFIRLCPDEPIISQKYC